MCRLGGSILLWLWVTVWAVGVAGAQQATVTAIVRVVEHRRAETTQWLRSRVGTQLAEGDRVRTGPRSYAEIAFADRSVLKLNERSELTVHSPTPQQQDVELHQGSLWARFIKGSRATVRVKTTVAAVRGTTISVAVSPEGAVTIRVWDGSVTVTLPTGEEVTLQSGQELTVPPTPLERPQVRSAPSPAFGSDPSPAGSDSSFVDWTTTGVATTTLPGAPDFGSLLKNSDEYFNTVPPLPQPGAPLPPQRPTGEVGVIVRQAVLEGSVLGLTTDRRPHRLLGARLRPRGSFGPIFVSLSLLPLTDTAGNTETQLAEAVVTYRQGNWSLRLGRQWLSEGPVLGNAAVPDPTLRVLDRLGPISIGKLVVSDIADAATLHLPVGRSRLTLAYLQDALPFVGGTQQGGYGRIAFPVAHGQVGLSALKIRRGTVGYAADFVLPAVPNEIDIYGEAGRHSLLRSTYYTAGIYLAGLFYRTGTDVFVEYTKAPRGAPNMVTVRLYYPLLPGWKLVAVGTRRGAVGRMGAGTDWSVGLLYSTAFALR